MSTFENSDIVAYLQAFKNHKSVDLFYKPGECDITGNVDFGYLTEAMQDIGKKPFFVFFFFVITKKTVYPSVKVIGPITQRSFLLGMQIEERTKALAAAAESEERKNEIQNASKRLVNPQGMGNQYQFLGIVPNDATTGKVLPHPFGEADRTGK